MAYKLDYSKTVSDIRKNTTTHPAWTFHIFVISISWILLTILFLLKLPPEPGIIFLTYVGLLGSSALITFWGKGKIGLLQLFSESIKWRLHIGYYLFAITAIPVLTILISLLMGTYSIVQSEWISTIQRYFIAVLSGFFIINLWEETGWTGFVQSRLMKKYGILKGSLLTAPGFVAVHIPLYLNQPSVFDFFTSLAILLFLAFFFRYLLGMLYIDSNKSLFIVGLLHASFNYSAFNHKDMLSASIIATIIITISYSVIRHTILKKNF